jgi:hypothetical protein
MESSMKQNLISLSIAAVLGSLAFHSSAFALTAVDSTVARAERPEKPEKPEKKEKVGALESATQLVRAERPEKVEKPEKKEKIGAVEGAFQLAREASERPRGADNERPGDRQRRGGRNV